MKTIQEERKTIQEKRKEFDMQMSLAFAERRILTQFDVEKAMKIAGFTWRRFAFWVQKVGKQLFRECEQLVRNNGILGLGKAKLSRKAHFA
jgi:hypothetical protein